MMFDEQQLDHMKSVLDHNVECGASYCFDDLDNTGTTKLVDQNLFTKCSYLIKKTNLLYILPCSFLFDN
jgi:hypothetical protein